MKLTGLGQSVSDWNISQMLFMKSQEDSMKHQHKFIPHKRLNRIVLSRCGCGSSKTDLIRDFSPEQVETIDAYIKLLAEEIKTCKTQVFNDMNP
jgi:hypothetical protein